MADLPESVTGRFARALSILSTAYEYSRDSRADRWQFAIELSELIASGATLADIRWLILRGFAEHAKETTIPGDAHRSFRPLTPTCFPPDTCLVLSCDGAAMVRRAVAMRPAHTDENERIALTSEHSGRRSSAAVYLTPEWDAVRRKLRYNRKVIKRFRVPAPNQELVLTAFQEMGWPRFIDDPLPPAKEQDSKHRLRVTIKSLNRHQIASLLRFHGNGNGLQVYWERVSSPRA